MEHTRILQTWTDDIQGNQDFTSRNVASCLPERECRKDGYQKGG
ncbi:MAG: hypothetical protein ACMUHB_01275 [Thermoplasmatota archaeon]